MYPAKVGQRSALPVILAIAIAAGSGAAWTPRVMAQPYGPAVPTGGGGPGPMTSGFTYQGLLKVNGTPVTGSCDFIFSLWDAQSVGNQLGINVQWPAQAVTNGLFSTVLNGSGEFNEPGALPFMGDMRYIETSARCPAGTGFYTTLSPREAIYAVPYAMGLMPGTYMLGSAYQTLKIQNSTTVTGIPAGVTGEMTAATDGVGVYGASWLNAPGAIGMGVWGRTYSQGGVGVKGTGLNGAVGVMAEGYGTGTGAPALLANNTNSSTAEPAGIAIYAVNASADATIVARNTGTGNAFRVINPAGTSVVYSVANTGAVSTNSTIAVGTLGAAGSTTLCRNASNQIAACSSSGRYKHNVANLPEGMGTLAQLRPVTFDWLGTGAHDLGFVAEEVERVAPTLVTRDESGQVEGVKYDRIGAVLVKALQEQQGLIATLQAANAALEARIAMLEQRRSATFERTRRVPSRTPARE